MAGVAGVAVGGAGVEGVALASVLEVALWVGAMWARRTWDACWLSVEGEAGVRRALALALGASK